MTRHRIVESTDLTIAAMKGLGLTTADIGFRHGERPAYVLLARAIKAHPAAGVVFTTERIVYTLEVLEPEAWDATEEIIAARVLKLVRDTREARAGMCFDDPSPAADVAIAIAALSAVGRMTPSLLAELVK